MHVLVVGAGGILAPAARALAERGHDVTGVALSPDGIPDGVERLVGDAHDPALVATGRWDAAVAYLPAVGPRALAALDRVVDGPVVRVEVSAAADPVHGDEPVLPPLTLLLGWNADGASARWHTPSEVSAAAVAVLDDGQSRILGAVRPWSDRP